MQKSSTYKILKKTIATIIVFVMVFQFIPNIVIAVSKSEDTKEKVNNREEDIQKRAKEEPVVIGELEKQRTLNEKHFLRSDGTIIASIFPSNIHYEKDGKFLDVDNTLEEVTDTKEILKITDEKVNQKNIEKKLNPKLYEEEQRETKIYTNKMGNAKIAFTNKTNRYNIGSIESEGNTITWGLVNSQASSINVNNLNLRQSKIKGYKAEELEINIPQTKIKYDNILQNTSIEYSIEPEHIKENIILKNKKAITNELKFTYDIGSLEMKLLSTKDIIIYDKTEDNVKFTIEAPYMYDGKLDFSNDIEIKLEKQESKYIVTLIPNKNWLNSEERIYPVTIDPSIITSRYYQDIQDTFTYSTQGSNPKGNSHILRAGNGGSVPSRSLVKFNLPELKAGDQVIGAYLNIFSYPKTTEWTPPTRQIQLDVHKMTGDWNEETATWSNTYASYNSKIEDFVIYQFDYNNQCKQYNFNITSIAKEWYTTGNNYGVMIKEHEEANNVPGNEAYFISADTTAAWYEGRPVVQIIYRNQTGLEDYLSYHVQDLGRAGTVYTNDYNGNLTWIHEDITTPGERMPVTIKHIYNTNDKDTASRAGNGIRLNIEQTIELVTIGGVEYAEYTDEDGTRHYFTKESENTYKDEDGLGLELTMDANTAVFVMKDKEDNILRFERRTVAGRYLWQLKEIEDNNGNKAIISFLDTFTDQFIITKVTDAMGQEITFQYNDYYLWKITGPDGKIIEYTYLNNGALNDIKYPDGKETSYDFQENLLYMVVKIDGTTVNYEYYPENTKRVKKITEYATDLSVGDTLTMTYSNNLTTFTDNKGYSNNSTFNDWGQAICTADFGKGNLTFSEAYGKVYNYGTEGGNKNKITLEGNLTKSVKNLLINGSAEYDGEWSFENLLGNIGTAEYTILDRYSGNRSFKFTSNYTENIEVVAQQTVNVPKGKKYTLSAQVKNNGKNGAFLHLYYINSEGLTSMETNYISENLSEWSKCSVTIDYPSDAESSLYVTFGIINSSGSVFFDDIQLEEGIIANQYNMIENSGFEYSGDSDKSWTTLNAISGVDTVTTLSSGENAFKIVGDTNINKYICQYVTTAGKAGDTFSISGWAYAGGTRNKTGGTLTELTVNVVGNNNQQQWISLGLYSSDQWQFIQKEFVAQHDYKRIDVYFCFYKNVNETYITNIALYKDHFGQSYQYDSRGNLIKAQDLAKQNSTFDYDGNDNLIKSTNPNGGTFQYQYDSTHKHRLTKAISSTGVNYNFTYNQYGEATTSKITNTQDNKYIETTAEYTQNGSYLKKITDEKGNETNYTYNQISGTLTKVTDSNNKETNYTYDAINRISTVTKVANEQNYQNSYTYANDKINTITHNGFNYSFIYNKFGNISQVKVGNQILATNTYETGNGNLNNVKYGNNSQISYTYDRFNRITTQTRAQGTYQYDYDSKSNLAYTKSPDGITTQYTYDLSGRLINSKENRDSFSKSYTYDNNSNIKDAQYKCSNNISKINYTYDKENRPLMLQITTSDINTGMANVFIDYDNLSRISEKTYTGVNGFYSLQYMYELSENNKTTSRVKNIYSDDMLLSYEYDNIGNIKEVSGESKIQYKYDELNQLIRENNRDLNKTITYTYDLGGNITAKKEYPYTTGELGTATKIIIYSYENTNWKDQLTSYNGKQITYDFIGNPLTYNGNTYTWQNGRELKSIINTETGLNTNYNYNSEGIRTSKTINGTTTDYYLEGTNVIYEKTGNNIIYYFYDTEGSILGLKYNGIIYYYIKNLQGDIIGIIDKNMNHVVSYTYDSWGKIVSIKDEQGNEITDQTHIGLINPYRYRSYRYDTETGLYYLNSRYYNPEWGRFINGDNYGGQVGELLSHSIYIYCGNNPINRYDPTGLVWAELIEGIKQAVQSLTPVYAGAGGLAVADGPLPFGDILGTIGAIGITVGVLGHSIYDVATRPKTISIPQEKIDTILKVPPRSPQYWSADKNAIELNPLTYPEARLTISTGQNVICINQSAALALVGTYRTRVIDKAHHGGVDGYYNHYHLNNTTSYPHIWFYGPIVFESDRVR